MCILYLYLYIISDPCVLPADNEVDLHIRIKPFPTFRSSSRSSTSPLSSPRVIRPLLSPFGTHHAIIIRDTLSCSSFDLPSSFEDSNSDGVHHTFSAIVIRPRSQVRAALAGCGGAHGHGVSPCRLFRSPGKIRSRRFLGGRSRGFPRRIGTHQKRNPGARTSKNARTHFPRHNLTCTRPTIRDRRATSHHMPLPLPYNIATPLNRQSKVHNPAQRTSLTRKIGSGWRSGMTDLARLNPVIETNH